MPPTHEDLVDLWAAASGDVAWRAQVQALAASHRQLLLAIADARYVDGVDGEDDARRSRTTYAALSRDVDPSSPVDVRRVHRLFEGPFDGGWPLELMHRGFRHAADRETELRCGTLCAQQLVVDGAHAEGVAVVEAILDRTGGTGVEPEGAALLILHAALSNTSRWVEAVPAASAAARWTDGRGKPGWRVIATGNLVRTLLTLRATAEAEAALEAHAAAAARLPSEGNASASATVRRYAATVRLFRGDAAGALAELRATAAGEATSPTSGGLREFLDVEVEALRRLRGTAEARRLVAAARARAPARSEHLEVLAAALAAAEGDVRPALELVEAWGGHDAPPAGTRHLGVSYVLDAALDGPGAAELGARAGAVLGAAIAARIDEVAAFGASFPRLAPSPEDAAVLARRVAPDGPRDGGAWAVAREALAACEGVRSALRLDRDRPVCCAACGGVATMRHGVLPLRPVLPLDDAGFHLVERCPACPGA